MTERSRRGAEPAGTGRDVLVGLVVTAGRIGVSTGRIALYPARVVARSPLGGPVRARAGGLAAVGQDAGVGARRRVEAAAEDVLGTPEAVRAVDGVLAGGLPEAVARSLVEHRVVERMVAEALASADLEAAIVSVLEQEQTERLVEAALASPALERLLLDAVESRLTLELSDQIVRSPAFRNALSQVVSSPEVRTALTRQTTSLAEEVAAAARLRATRLDTAAETRVRRWLHRPARTHGAPDHALPVPYAGVATRGLALVVDALLAQLIFLTAAASLGLVASLFGTLRPTWLAAALVAGGWLLVVGTYFTVSWTTAGQTPGMRLMRLRVLGTDGAPPGLGRSLLRLIGLAMAIALFFTGFLPALVDDRRRALQDFFAGTAVYYDEHAPPPPRTVLDATANPLPAGRPADHSARAG